MAHRIRYAMDQGPLREKLTDTIEVDETYIGGKARGKAHTGRGTTKAPVAVLGQCNGEARSWHVERVTIANLKEFIGKNVDKKSTVMTNDFKSYKWVKMSSQGIESSDTA